MSATLAGVPFRIDPETVNGGFRVKTAVIQTQGGKVVQVLGTAFEDLTVSGSFGKGGFGEQRAFLARIVSMARDQEQAAKTGVQTFRFAWPEKSWDFLVLLRGYSTPDGPMSARVSNRVVNPKWTLDLYIVNDNGTLMTAVPGSDVFIQRLSDGLNWKYTKYNGPLFPTVGG